MTELEAAYLIMGALAGLVTIKLAERLLDQRY